MQSLILDVARELERIFQAVGASLEESFFEIVRMIDRIIDVTLGRRAVREELKIH